MYVLASFGSVSWFLRLLSVYSVFSVINDDAAAFHDGADGVGADTDQIDRRPAHHDRVHLLPGLQAADTRVAIERIAGVARCADQPLLDGEPHPAAGKRERERH